MSAHALLETGKARSKIVQSESLLYHSSSAPCQVRNFVRDAGQQINYRIT